MKYRLAIVALALLGTAVYLGWSQTGLIHGQEPISARGQVVNGTQGGEIAPGLTISLHAFGSDVQSVETAETTTDDSGAFQFSDLIPTGGIGYALTMEYGGMTYSTLLGPEDLNGPVELTVFEPTQDLSVISVDQHALVITGIDEAQQQIEAVEFISLVNASDRTLVPDLSNVGQGQFSFLRFSLPPGASNFDIQSDLVGGEVIPVGTGFGLTSPVTPGEHNLSFSFRFPYEGREFSYQQNLLQGAGIFQVLIPERLGPVGVAGLNPTADINVEGSLYRVWEGHTFAPGQGFPVELSNLPQPGLFTRLGRSMSGSEFWIVTIPIVLGVALASALLYGVFRSPRPTAVVKAPMAVSANGSPTNRQTLVREIAALDNRFEQGAVSEDEYQSRRAELKRRVIAAAETSEAQARE